MSQTKEEGKSSSSGAKRAHEKQNMQGLNQRLEYYVQYQQKKQREYVRLEEQCKSEKDAAAAQLKAQQVEHQRQLQEWKNERRKLELALAEDKNSSQRFRRECDVLRMSKDSLKQDNRTLERKCVQFQADYGKLSSILQNTKNALANSERKLSNKIKEGNAQEHQISMFRDQSDAYGTENAKLQTRLKEAQEDLSTSRKEKGASVAALNKELTERKSAQKRLESELREEFQKKLEEFISQRRQQYEKEKEEWMRVFKEEYNRKIVAYKEANADYAQQIQQLQEDKNQQDEKLSKLKIQLKDCTDQINILETSEKEWRLKHDAVQKTSRETRTALQRRNVEYEQLRGENITLENEIQQYEKILGSEESRCFSLSPGTRPLKKRKLSEMNSCGVYNRKRQSPLDTRLVQLSLQRPSSGIPQRTPKVEPKIEASEQKMDTTSEYDTNTSGGDYTSEYVTPGALPSSLAFSSMDLEGACLEIKNDSNKKICLKGWTLTNKDKTKKLHLPPNRTLGPGERVRIVIGPHSDPSKNDIHWAQDVWTGEDNDQACLFDSKHKLKSLIEIGPDMITGAMTNDRGGCSLM